MFRELTRKKQALSEAACDALLQTAKRGVLSVLGDDGYPYGLPINHWYDAQSRTLYFHSGKGGHKADALARCDKASFCVMDDGVPEGEWALRFQSVIAFGRVQPVSEPALCLRVANALSRKFTDDEAYIADEIDRFFAATRFYALRVEHLSGKSVLES